MTKTADTSVAGDRLQRTRAKILKEALPEVPFDGWTGAVLMRAAKAAGVDHGMARLAFPNGARDLAEFFLADGDRRMLAALAVADLDAMKIREKITFAVRTRLEVDADNREALRRATLSLVIPPASGSAAKALYNTVDAIWVAIGDTSTDFNFYTKRATLAGVFGATLTFWFADESDGFEDTWAFLDRRIADVMQIEKVKAQANRVMDKLPDPLGLLARLRYPSA
ncbi:MAG: COQ9 family protein [Parvibaculaceae bacterium]